MYADSQIIAILTQAEAGSLIPEPCCQHGMSTATLCKWRAKFGGGDASFMAPYAGAAGREQAPEEDMHAEGCLETEIVDEGLAKKW